jgi:Flp pilus assembly protein TadB
VSRLLVPSALLLWVGATLLLSRLRWFARPPLADRLRPYAPQGLAEPARRRVLSVESFRDAVAPLSRSVAERVSRLLGVSEDLEVRLRRIHSPLDSSGFRVRQVGYSLAAFGVAALIAAAARPPVLIALLILFGVPLLAFLALEQQVALASDRWKRSLFLELPVLAEQIAMLLAAGYSLTGALTRISQRGQGAGPRDLARVCGRTRQGLSESEALREWAETAQVPALDHLVPVLALNREASDLGRLLSDEAKGLRREVQRELVEAMERKEQQVWIPVTVATLLPGVLFMVIPFIEVLRQFGG